MNHLAKYLTMKIIPREYENDLDQIELAIYGMEGLLCNLSTLFVAIILSFIFLSPLIFSNKKEKINVLHN